MLTSRNYATAKVYMYENGITKLQGVGISYTIVGASISEPPLVDSMVYISIYHTVTTRNVTGHAPRANLKPAHLKIPRSISVFMPAQFATYSTMKLRPLGTVLHRSGHSHQTGDSGLSLHVRQVRFTHTHPKMLCIALV